VCSSTSSRNSPNSYNSLLSSDIAVARKPEEKRKITFSYTEGQFRTPAVDCEV
jgi:hypothetical protein